MFYVATIGLLAMAFWLVVFRFTSKPDSNWPLFFWGLAIFHVSTFEMLSAYVVWFGLATALFLRFEFMGVGFVRLFTFLELPALCYVGFTCLTIILAN